MPESIIGLAAAVDRAGRLHNATIPGYRGKDWADNLFVKRGINIFLTY
jgi:hypothetical protein